MNETAFRLVFKGDYFPDCDLPEVKKKIAALLKADQSKVAALFSGKEVTLRSRLSCDEAMRLKAVFETTGGLSYVEPMEESRPRIPHRS